MAAYRNDLDALRSRHASLEAELAETAQQVAEAAQLLEEARAKAKRAVLDNIRVASPCAMKWEDMTGDERVRACAACNKNVFNLSSLTREEAETLIVEKEGTLCVRYYQRKDGTILLKDCSVGVRDRRKRRVIAAGAALLLGGAAWAAFRPSHECGSAPAVPPTQGEEIEAIAGGVSPAPDPIPDPPVAVDDETNFMLGALAPVRVEPEQ